MLPSRRANDMWRRTLLLACITTALSNDVTAAPLLEKVVLISRHGVRSPTETHPPLADIASRPWPGWPVAPGELTPRGEKLAALMGEYYRKLFADRGLIEAKGCPAANDVFVWADVDQRTRRTGEGLLRGLFPGCGLTIKHRPIDAPDPVFHPVRAGVCSIDGDRGRTAVLDRAGGNLDVVLQRYRRSLGKLQSVTDCCAPRLCREPRAKRCTLLNMASEVAVRQKDGGVGLAGPITIGSTASEVFLLEHAEGLPPREVAWGRLTSSTELRSLLRLHRLQFDLIERTPYLARRQASALVNQVLDALRPASARTSNANVPADPPPGSKLVIYVGHDTNLANIGGMLDLHWKLPTYLPDETPPAGALAIELLREPVSGRHFVRMTYLAQTLDQMRHMRPLSLARPPAHAKVAIPACSNRGGVCPWQDFEANVKKALDPDCVP
jgi:4-phytase/acid phosphatase